jgi:hypothetical protein
VVALLELELELEQELEQELAPVLVLLQASDVCAHYFGPLHGAAWS